MTSETVVNISASTVRKGEGTIKDGYLCELPKGARYALYEGARPKGLLIVPPDAPPLIVYFDGTTEELGVGEDGTPILPPTVATGQSFPLDVA